jgi:hypothetical protein
MEFLIIGESFALGLAVGVASISLITYTKNQKRLRALEQELATRLEECLQWEALFEEKVYIEVNKRFQEDRGDELQTVFPEVDPIIQKVSKPFYEGMGAYIEGFDRPSQESPSQKILGWIAAQQMDAIRRRYLQIAKDTFVDVEPQV